MGWDGMRENFELYVRDCGYCCYLLMQRLLAAATVLWLRCCCFGCCCGCPSRLTLSFSRPQYFSSSFSNASFASSLPSPSAATCRKGGKRCWHPRQGVFLSSAEKGGKECCHLWERPFFVTLCFALTLSLPQMDSRKGVSSASTFASPKMYQRSRAAHGEGSFFFTFDSG